MKNIYNIEKIIDNLYSKGYTNFISPKELKLFAKIKVTKNTDKRRTKRTLPSFFIIITPYI